jgi:hypothetical protein
MPWKKSNIHDSNKDDRLGKHRDIYHVNKAGKRDRPHKEDLKIDDDPDKPFLQDIIPPEKSSD